MDSKLRNMFRSFIKQDNIVSLDQAIEYTYDSLESPKANNYH